VARFVELRKPAEKQDAANAAKHAARIAAALAFAAERVPASGFTSGSTIGIADITLAAALGYIDLRYVHDWRGKHPRLAQWLAAISARPSFIETQPPKS
jgi:glutathione S-transferase